MVVCGDATEKDGFAFLGHSAVGRRMTAEDELEQLSEHYVIISLHYITIFKVA